MRFPWITRSHHDEVILALEKQITAARAERSEIMALLAGIITKPTAPETAPAKPREVKEKALLPRDPLLDIDPSDERALARLAVDTYHVKKGNQVPAMVKSLSRRAYAMQSAVANAAPMVTGVENTDAYLRASAQAKINEALKGGV